MERTKKGRISLISIDARFGSYTKYISVQTHIFMKRDVRRVHYDRFYLTHLYFSPDALLGGL